MGTSVASHPLAMKTFLILIVAAVAPPVLIKGVKADINDDMLKQHNDYRAKHNAGPLTIDQDLMDKAQAWADELAAKNKFEHTTVKNLNGECLGENIAMMSGGEAGAADATRMWYCEVDDYYGTINKWQNSPAIGHFTQVVWKDSQRVGFGFATGSDGMTRVVANYQPCGNMNFNSPSGAAANVDMADGSATCQGGCEDKMSYCQPIYKRAMCQGASNQWFIDDCPALCETC